uniref:uncharacterized protein LOC100187358 isoform X4 n=1 Tax=Ciona intestinalis TaxID=7719 RepID=UPI00006A4E8E|nr:uncharacterized protein LOC100187358 isoform X4 [Ciona intestinalis]XP_026690093.1 uncharacterized protein LOC100187358 isoform X5 [Ciona intestinalis]|eukprot:XP_026690092.1 uncharacterized protein LOC100187358 isoform X4 [Ciona intestinalis]
MNKKVVAIAVICAFLCLAQIGLGLYAFFEPKWLVGTTTLATVETFQNPIDPDRLEDRLAVVNNMTLNNNTDPLGPITPVQAPPLTDPTTIDPNAIYVDAAIGILQTVINGKSNNENREGLKSVVGFVMISLVASTFSLFHCMSLLISECCGCRKCEKGCKTCRTCLKFVVKKLKDVAASSYAASVSAAVSDAMFAYTANDLTDIQFGPSVYVLIASVLLSITTGLLSIDTSKKEKKNEENRQRYEMRENPNRES